MDLSILITYHNEGKLLLKCLESIIHQLEEDDKILVYDDASSDEAQNHLPTKYNVKVVRGETNVGPAIGRNNLLKLVTTKYVHFHDADDLFSPNWAKVIKKELIIPSLDAIFTEISSYENGVLISEMVQGLKEMTTKEELVKFCMQGAILTSSGTYKTSLVNEIGGYREALWQSEDFDFHIRLAARGLRYKIIVEPLVIRTQKAGRSSREDEVYLSQLQAIEFLSKEINSDYKPELSEAAARIGSKLFKLGLYLDAKKSFKLSHQLGTPSYLSQGLLYKLCAKIFGPLTSEWIGVVYRKILPSPIRAILRNSLKIFP